MSRGLRTFALVYTSALTVGAASVIYYTRNVQHVAAEQQPVEFKRLVFEGNSHGFYRRSMKQPASLSDVVTAVFQQPLYKLEFWLSQTTFPRDGVPRLEKGAKIGNMTLESVTSQGQVVYRYIHPDYNFRFFLAQQPANGHSDLEFGFVDYTGSELENLGSKVYIPMLLEGAARRLETRDPNAV
ncbi:hypothetical protein HDU91_001658 [Kappamyces sp. JEL0680]|nr:hypothetical protein HDU91_001658 [Kappamyces sp. JEL0680]